MEDTPPAEEDGVLASATRLFQTLRDTVQNRAELFLIELKEERARLFEALLLVAAGILCAFMALITITFLIVAAFWAGHRLLVLALLTAIYAGAALAAFFTLRGRLQRWRAFSATLEQIKKDQTCFKKQN